MPIIDAHVHLYPPETNRDPAGWAAARGETHWALLCTRRRRDGRPVQGFPDTGGLLRAMDAGGVARAVLLGWYWERPATCTEQNRFYARCVRAHPDRLSAFATLHPAAGEAATLAELRRAHGEGLIGLGELSPPAQGYAADDPVFRAALALAGELRMPVNLHVTDPAARPYPGKTDTPADDFTALARAFPRTTFILAHWGGRLPVGDARFAGLPNVCYDTAASPLLYGPEIWPEMLAALGRDRVLFGSDYPLDLYPKSGDGPGWPRFLAEARAGGADAAVLGGNAARVLGIGL